MASFSHRISMAVSMVKAAAGTPGARYAADLGLFTTTAKPSIQTLGIS